MASEKIFTPVLKLEHSDSRGEIYSVSLPDNRELMLIHSKAGALRGGHSHDVPEIVVLLSGKMRYHKSDLGPVLFYDMGGGQSSYNAAAQVHMGEFLEDSWLIEYKLADKGEWIQTDYEPMREKVRASSQG